MVRRAANLERKRGATEQIIGASACCIHPYARQSKRQASGKGG